MLVSAPRRTGRGSGRPLLQQINLIASRYSKCRRQKTKAPDFAEAFECEGSGKSFRLDAHRSKLPFTVLRARLRSRYPALSVRALFTQL